MKIVCCLISLFLVGCQSVRNHSGKVDLEAKEVRKYDHLNLKQWLYILTYENYRRKGIEKFKLSEDATLEDFRPHIISLLGLPETTSFTGILSHPKVEALLTEDRRRSIIATFHLSEDATWFDIQSVAEHIRIQRLKSK